MKLWEGTKVDIIKASTKDTAQIFVHDWFI